MFDSVSYKMDIEEIKSKIRENYMQIAYQFVMSDEYKKAKRKGLTEVIIDVSVYLLIDFMLFVQAYRHKCLEAQNYFFFAFLMLFLTPLIMYLSFCFQNSKFIKKIKKSCIKGMLKNLSDTEYMKAEELPENPCILTNDDIVNLKIFGKFSKKLPDDVMFGNYKGCAYNVQEVKVSSMSNKAKYMSNKANYMSNKAKYFMGMALKTNITPEINGWIEVFTRNFFITTGSLFFYLLFFSVFGLIFICWYNACFKGIPNYGYFLPVLIFIVFIISYFAAKTCAASDLKKYNELEKDAWLSSNPEINKKFVIKTSDNITDVDKIITPDFCEVIEKLCVLFQTKEVFCKFENSNLILLINTQENLFEIGDLLYSPVNKRVAERFISQQAGILLLMDYVNSVNKIS